MANAAPIADVIASADCRASYCPLASADPSEQKQHPKDKNLPVSPKQTATIATAAKFADGLTSSRDSDAAFQRRRDEQVGEGKSLNREINLGQRSDGALEDVEAVEQQLPQDSPRCSQAASVAASHGQESHHQPFYRNNIAGTTGEARGQEASKPSRLESEMPFLEDSKSDKPSPTRGARDNNSEASRDEPLLISTRARDNSEESRGEFTLRRADVALERLYQTHDRFFSRDKAEKHRLLKKKVSEVLDALSLVGDVRGIKQRARVSYIRGRALDVLSHFDPEAEKCLARAVKLHPTEPDGWTALGHCFWKKKDLLTAKRCFLQALDKGRKPNSLRQLSMLLRQLSGTPEESNGHLQDSLRLAKEAVTLDAGNGESWYVLGNAYVTSFFRLSGGMKDLDRALQAYKKAETSDVNRNPDLFFNRAQVLQYREDYPDAICYYRAAFEVDPLLPVGPALDGIETAVRRLARLVHRRGGLKPKRLAQLVAPLKSESARKGLSDSYRLSPLKGLRIGVNKGMAVALKLVAPAGESPQPPERLVMVDANEDCIVLSLYSITKQACSRIQPKDTLVVRNPCLRRISFDPRAPNFEAGTTRSPAGQCQSRSTATADVHGIADVVASARSTSTPSFLTSFGDTSRGDETNRVSTDGVDGSCLSYPGIQADPAEILLNGESIMADFVPDSVRLAYFDK